MRAIFSKGFRIERLFDRLFAAAAARRADRLGRGGADRDRAGAVRAPAWRCSIRR
jgi:hypothetical protein